MGQESRLRFREEELQRVDRGASETRTVDSALLQLLELVAACRPAQIRMQFK